MTTMYAVYDTYNKKLFRDGHGHVKLYATEIAARRKAQAFNNSTFPKIDRMAIIEVRPMPKFVRGKADFTRV